MQWAWPAAIQAAFSLQGLAGSGREVLGHAKTQERVYFLFTKVIDLWLAARPEGWRIHAFNVGVFGLSPLCFAYAVFRGRAERFLYSVVRESVVGQLSPHAARRVS